MSNNLKWHKKLKSKTLFHKVHNNINNNKTNITWKDVYKIYVFPLTTTTATKPTTCRINLNIKDIFPTTTVQLTKARQGVIIAKIDQHFKLLSPPGPFPEMKLVTLQVNLFQSILFQSQFCTTKSMRARSKENVPNFSNKNNKILISVQSI